MLSLVFLVPLLFSVSVTDFGAVPGDFVDDTAAFQAAFDVGGVVSVPEGIFFVVPDVLSVAGDVTVVGVPSKSIIRVANSAGPFRSLISGTANVTFDGLVFDMNDRHQDGDPSIRSDDRREALRLSGSLTVNNTVFRDSDSINVIIAENATITGSVFSMIGGGVHDHSTVYVTDDSLVDGNRFVGRGNARTAIETHGENVRVTNNEVVGYEKGLNLTGAGYGVTHGHQVVAENRFIGGMYGIVMWSISDGPFDNIVIARNVIQVDKGRWLPRGQVTDAWLWLYPATQPVTHLRVYDNQIFYSEALPVTAVDFSGGTVVDPVFRNNTVEVVK